MTPSALSASVVAAIQDLELAARVVVEGMRAGTHRSPFHGFSAEFQQHRPYRPGDDLKHLDWKLLARTDRLHTRQFRETTSLSLMLVLDTSASMAFPEEGLSRFRYGAVLSAALAWLVVTAGDSAGLLTTVDGELDYLPARAGRAHLRSLVSRIDGLEPRGTWRAPEAIVRSAELLKRRGVVVVVSDFYDHEEESRAALARAARRGHDVAMVHLTSHEEITFPYAGDLELEDAETGERRLVRADAAADAYRAAVRDFLRRSGEAAARDGVDHVLVSTAEPPSRALQAFLLRRYRRAAAPGGAPGGEHLPWSG